MLGLGIGVTLRVCAATMAMQITAMTTGTVAFAQYHVWFEDLVVGKITMTELATREGMKVSSVAKLIALTFLAPNIVEAILAGTQSGTAVAHHLIRSDLPIQWKDQRATILARSA